MAMDESQKEYTRLLNAVVGSAMYWYMVRHDDPCVDMRMAESNLDRQVGKFREFIFNEAVDLKSVLEENGKEK